MVIHSFCRKRK